MADPRGFIKHKRQTPSRRPVPERTQDWREFYLPQSEDSLKTQGSRCMDCGVPFCQSPHGCPVENLIPDWNDLVHRGRWKEALKALHSTNNFPEFTGKLCPAPCESACVLGVNADPVTIRSIESAIIDRGFAEGWVAPILATRRTGKKVAVVGSGPAGLAAAQQLARAGHDVTVYEKAPRAGGLLRYGIPEFKMEKRVLDRRLEQLAAEGVVFRTDVDVGANLAADELLATHDAVCLALGAEEPRDLRVPGRMELRGIYPAMEYLTRQNWLLEGAHDAWGPDADARGKRVIIIGGGDTGSDCLGTAHRQGCASAAQFELLPEPPRERSELTPWPLWPMQLRSSHAHEEGCERQWSVSTTEFLGHEGRVTGLRAVRVAPEGGKLAPVAGTEFEMRADLILLAMGFTGPRPGGIIESLGLKQDARGNVATDTGYRTSRPGVYAAGDVRRGASLIVWAIAEGRKMAAAVDHDLLKKL
jgi:glutamate synthase (NADPH/NADH) small chain